MFEKTLDSLIYLIQVNQLKYNDQWERIICLIEKGYGNGFFKVWIKTPMDENQTIHNRTTTWLVWMQNYSSLSSSSSSQPSRFPPCCFRRVSYTSHSITCTLTDWDFEFGVFWTGFQVGIMDERRRILQLSPQLHRRPQQLWNHSYLASTSFSIRFSWRSTPFLELSPNLFFLTNL